LCRLYGYSAATAGRVCGSLLEIRHGLSDWEADFVEDCSKWMGDFTDRQIEKILEIYDREG